MKQAIRNRPQLSAVLAASAREGRAPDSADSLKEFFSGWLDSVVPELSREQPPITPACASGYRHRTVTATDIVRLNRATVRESTDHRHWPPDVVAQFLAAEVIRKRQKST